jgi:hypothetical protein
MASRPIRLTIRLVYSPVVTETAPYDLSLPEALAEVFSIGFDWEWDEESETARGCDFEPYEAFEAPVQTAWWFRLWTGNPEVDGSEFRFFGSTGAGDYAGFWLVRPGAPVIDQPIVYIGSEGQRGVVARDLGDLLWLFAAGYGPAEAVEDRGGILEPNDAFRAIAERHAPGRELPVEQIVSAAQAEFQHFSDSRNATLVVNCWVLACWRELAPRFC